MSYFEFPHTRSYDGDLGYIIKKLDELNARYNNFFDYNSIKFHDPITWNIETVYTAFEIVYDEQSEALYISKNAVPVGIDILNTDYWLLVSPFKIDTAFSSDSINPVANSTLTRKIGEIDTNIADVDNKISTEAGFREYYDGLTTARVNNLAHDLSTETETRETADAAINARIDEFERLEEGSTTGDAELADIRVWFNGETSVTAGDATRGQATLLQSEITTLNDLFVFPPENMFDPDDVTEGYFTGPDGSTAANASWGYIEFTGLTAGETYSIAGGRHMTCYFHTGTPGAISGGSDSSINEVVTIPVGADVMRVSFLLANENVMVVAASNSIVTIDDINAPVTPSSNLDLNSYKTTVYTIGLDYNNLRAATEAILSANPSYMNRYIIKIPEGTYNIRSLFTALELETTKGIFVPPFTKLIGIGNPENVILTWNNPATNSTQAVLNIDCTAELENLTLHGENLRYALHDDWTVRKWDNVTPYSEYWFEPFNIRGYVRTIKNCIFEVVDSPVKPAWGAGIVNGVNWLFENCKFISNKPFAASCHNNTSFTKPSQITFRNCVFTSSDSYFMRLTSMVTGANGIINQVTFEGNNNIDNLKFILSEENPDAYGSGCLWTVNGFGNAFNNSKGVISTTDGLDYSDRLNLIG